MDASAWKERVQAVTSHGAVQRLLAVLRRYDAAGGSLLAGGLAYSALFALVPLVLVTAGLTGLLVADPAVRNRVVTAIGDVLPPLRGLVEAILGESAREASTISLLGAVTFFWGGSRFVLAFTGAVSRVTGNPSARSVVRQNLIGLATALTLVVTVVLGAGFAGLAAILDDAVANREIVALSILTRFALALLPLLLAVATMAFVYRFVPGQRPSWSATIPPAVAVAVALTILTRAFVFLAPRLIGTAATIGSLATAFAALAWLALTFQAILMGAAWAGERQAAGRVIRG
ncbi:MAG: YihY/virulence factor BrkB family protein [Chloroflexi bacterium]|nr:YihY/virulence factor BrkB family protein [Chloroflexota bacterium]